QWTRGVFATALRRLRDACAQAGKAGHYALLEQYDLDDARPTYAELAQRFGIAVTDVTNRLFRVRRELRHVVLEVLRELTASEEEFLEEARALLGEDAARPDSTTERSHGCARRCASRISRGRSTASPASLAPAARAPATWWTTRSSCGGSRSR